MKNESDNTRWYNLAGIWFGGIVSVPALLIGSTLITSLDFSSALRAGLTGFVFVVAFMSLISVAAVEKRKTTVALAASSFGDTGANVIVGLVIGLSTLGWFAVQSHIAGSAFAQIILQMNGTDVPTWICTTFWGAIMVVTAVFGFKYLKWLNYVAVPSMILLLAYGLTLTFQAHDFQEVLDFVPPAQMPFLQAVGLTIGFISVAGVISADYNRFAATKRDAILGSVAGILPSALSLLAIGAILAITQGTYDIVKIFSALGYPFYAMSILILATWTSNVVNVYSAGLAFNNLFQCKDAQRPKTTLAVGAMGIFLASAGFINHFTGFISTLTITVTPVAGVIISDYFIAKTYRETPPRFQWEGMLAWVAGGLTMVLMSSPIKNILGIVAAAGVYYLLKKLVKLNINSKHV